MHTIGRLIFAALALLLVGGACSSSGSGSATGGTGGSATGGTGGSAAGGTGGGAVCGASGGAPGSCTPSSPIDPCENCVADNCCAERKTCLATSPNDPCGWGPAGGYISEGSCFQHCFKQQLATGASVSQADAMCSTNCVATGCTTISPATSALMSCLESFCLSQCLT